MIFPITHRSSSTKHPAHSLAVAGLALTLLLVLTACGGGPAPEAEGAEGGGQAGAQAVGTPVPFEPTATVDAGPTTLDMTSFEVGGQSHQLDESTGPLLQQSGMTWIKFQHKWEPGTAGSDVAGRIIDAHNPLTTKPT
jgi:hypothetical protein